MNRPGSSKRGYEGLTHDQRAAFSGYLEAKRLAAGLSQYGLAEQADVNYKAPGYFESHPKEPLSKESRRQQLSAIVRKLAEWLGEDADVMLGEASRLGGGVG